MPINYSEGKELYFKYLILDALLLHTCHYTAKETAHLKKNLIMYSTLLHISRSSMRYNLVVTMLCS